MWFSRKNIRWNRILCVTRKFETAKIAWQTLGDISVSSIGSHCITSHSTSIISRLDCIISFSVKQKKCTTRKRKRARKIQKQNFKLNVATGAEATKTATPSASNGCENYSNVMKCNEVKEHRSNANYRCVCRKSRDTRDIWSVHFCCCRKRK